MDVFQHWATIRTLVEQTLKTTHFCAVATINPDGSPHIAPIGSLFLTEAGKGFYFERFPKITRANLEQEQRLCVLAAPRLGLWSFVKALFRGRFVTSPGVRLAGRAGARRLASEEEQRRWHDRVKSYGPFRLLKGYKLVWGDLRYVREITFDAFEPLTLGRMTKGLWEDAPGDSRGDTPGGTN